MAKFTVTGEQYFSITGQLLEIQRQIRQKGGCPINPELLGIHLQSIIEGELNEYNVPLEQVFKDQPLTISPCNGTRTIASAEKLFVSIDEKFYLSALNESSCSTNGIFVQAYDCLKLAVLLRQVFSSFKVDLNKLCFTQDQIISICENHIQYFGKDNFFLFKLSEKFKIARVRIYDLEIRIGLIEFNDDRFWNNPRIFIPKITV